MKKREAVSASKLAYWQEQIDKWKESGQTQQAFCREKQLALSTFYRWREKVNPLERIESVKAKPAFLPVPLSTKTLVGAAVIEIELPSHTRLRFEGEAALSAIAALVERIR